MKNPIFLSVFVGLMLGFTACEEPISGEKTANQAPSTRLFLDTINTTTAALVDLYWDGDDPDGSVIGFYFSVDSGASWKFTTNRKESVVVPTGGKPVAVSRILVSAVDDAGNGQFDASVSVFGKVIGSEPYTDSDSSGNYTTGEPFLDLGLADPTPATVLITVRNSRPTAEFNPLAWIPEATLPIVTVVLAPTDPDGFNTLVKAELAMNDTSAAAWVDIPVNQTLITLASDSRDTSVSNTSFSIFLGTRLTDSGKKLPGIRFDGPNQLYYRVTDNAGVTSAISSLPGSGKNWTIRKFASGGNLLLIRDHSAGDADKWKTILAKVPGTNGSVSQSVDLFELKKSSGDLNLSASTGLLMMRATMRSYRKIIWYGASNTTYDYAQQLIPGYISQPTTFGKPGRILFRGGFDRNAPTAGLPLSFLPIDSLNYTYYYTDQAPRNGFTSAIASNGGIRKDLATADFPITKPDLTFFNTLPDSLLYSGFGNTVQNSYFSFVPNTNAFVLYRLNFPRRSFGENWPVNPTRYQSYGTPVVMVENLDRNFIFTTIPLIYLDQPTPGYPKNGFDNALIDLLAKILNEEFERP